MSEKTTARPYLPELESVTVTESSIKIASLAAMVLLGVVIASFITLAYALVRYYLGPGWPDLRVWLPAGVVFTVIAVYFLMQTSWFNYTMMVDGNGITTQGVRNSRSIAWSDITGLQLQSGSSSGMQCKVLVGKRKFTVAAMGLNGLVLLASILQHASRYKISIQGELPPLAHSLWTPIPDTIPHEMDWHNPKAIDHHTAVSGAVVVGSLILLAIYAVYRLGIGEQLYRYASHAFTAITGGLVTAFHSRFQTAQSVSVRMDRFEARTLLGSVYIPWSEIKSAQIVKNNLVICCGGFRSTVLIPCDVKSDDTIQLILATIRRLRSSEKPMPFIITEPIASVRYLTRPVDPRSVFETDDPVELKASTIQIAVLSLIMLSLSVVMLALPAILPVDFPLIKPYRIIAYINLALGIFVIFYMKSKLTRVDSSGITMRSLFAVRFVSWGEIASYSIKEYSNVPNASVHILKDANGRVLLSLVYTGRNSQHCRFETYVDVKLAGVPCE